MINACQTTPANVPAPGFIDAPSQSQEAFRALLRAMSRPGTVSPISGPENPPYGLSSSAAAVCLTLLDLDTSLWLDEPFRTPEIETYLHFHCGCPLTNESCGARFALLEGWREHISLEDFNPGLPDYPDRSATVFIQVQSLEQGRGVVLEGPGIKGQARLQARGLGQGFWESLKRNRQRFPQGVDVILVSPREVAGLPRSVRVKE